MYLVIVYLPISRTLSRVSVVLLVILILLHWSLAVWPYLTGNIVVELEARYSIEGRLLNLLTTHQHEHCVHFIKLQSYQSSCFPCELFIVCSQEDLETKYR